MKVERITREIHIWSTVVWIECYGFNYQDLILGLEKVEKFLKLVDTTFSTFNLSLIVVLIEDVNEFKLLTEIFTLADVDSKLDNSTFADAVQLNIEEVTPLNVVFCVN